MKRTYSLSEYLLWRGEFPFVPAGAASEVSETACAPFCEVDGLILSAALYLDYRGTENGCIVPFPLAEFASPDKPSDTERSNRMKSTKSDVRPLVAQMRETERFRTVFLTDFISYTDPRTEQQFAAMTVLLPDGSPVVVFRGTDESIVGWKEDCNMSYLPSIPSQESAVRYLTRAAKRHPGKITVCGHSKGGNLAVYAAVSAPERIRERITRVFSYDGPGFSREFVNSPAFAEMVSRIVTYIPESSLVGAFFSHGGEVRYVKSAERGLMQHMPLTWYVTGSRLTYAEGRSEFGQRMDEIVRNGIDTVSEKDRREFVELLFELLDATNAKTLGELASSGLNSVLAMHKSYLSFDRETRKRFRVLLLRMIALQREPKDKTKRPDKLPPDPQKDVLPEEEKGGGQPE